MKKINGSQPTAKSMGPYIKNRRASAERAMPDVKKLVRKHGRQTVAYCLNQLKEYEKKLKRLEQAKREVQQLEKDVN